MTALGITCFTTMFNSCVYTRSIKVCAAYFLIYLFLFGLCAQDMASESIQDTEIATLKSTFDGQVNDIQGVGDFTHVLSLRPAHTDVQCKFQLTASYPAEPPLVSVRSSVLSPEDTRAFTEFLQSVTEGFVGQAMIEDVMKEGMDWLNDNNINVEPDKGEGQKDKKKGKHKKRSKSSKETPEELTKEEESTKKPPMKTAADVIKRLQWDPDVDKEEFIVGYMDRLVGLQERPFTAFTWEDLAAVDQFALAIPQHRIQYFKYKNVKVWDKNERLDNVFGSTGSGCTITKAVARYEATFRQQDDGAVGDAAPADDNMSAKGEFCDNTCEVVENKADLEDSEKSNEACGIGKKDKYKKVNDENEHTDGKDSSKQKRSKKNKDSNYFLGLKLQDEETVRALVDVQRQVLELYPSYKEHVMNKNGFHLTLRLLSLRSDDEIRTCVEAMKKISNQVLKYMQKIEPLGFKGLDHFGPSVVFVKVKYTAAFMDLVEFISEKLMEAGVNIVSHTLNPHITLFKVPKSARSKANRDPPILLRFNDIDFGRQPVDNVHLCQMGTLTETSDFYTSAASILLKE